MENARKQRTGSDVWYWCLKYTIIIPTFYLKVTHYMVFLEIVGIMKSFG